MRKTLLMLTAIIGLGVAGQAHAASLARQAELPVQTVQYYGGPVQHYGADWRHEHDWRRHEWERRREWHRWHDEPRHW